MSHFTMVYVIFFLDCINPEIVDRATHDGRVLKPGRIDPAPEISEEEFQQRNLKPVVDFIQMARNEKLLRRVFDKALRPRYKRIGWDDTKVAEYRDTLVRKLIDETSIDLVRNQAVIMRGRVTAHTCKKGELNDRGPGIWFSELFVRALAKDPHAPVGDVVIQTIRSDLRPYAEAIFKDMGTNLEFFANVLLEEAQHMETDAVPHAKLRRFPDGTTNFGKNIEHDDAFVLAFRSRLRHILGLGTLEERLDQLIEQGDITLEKVLRRHDMHYLILSRGGNPDAGAENMRFTP